MNTDNIKTEIKRIRVGHVALLCAGIFLAFAIIGSVLLAAGGAWRQGWDFNLNNASFGVGELYEVNDRDEKDLSGITDIKISSVSDDITVLHGGDKVISELKGQCRSTGKPVSLEVKQQGGTLGISVKYPVGFGTTSSKTALTVTIPDGFQGSLALSTVSGEVNATALPMTLGDVKISTTSGDIKFDTAAYHFLTVSTTSGRVAIEKASAKLDVDTVSGDVAIGYDRFAQTEVNTVSGDVRAAVPGTAVFDVKFDTVSGDFRSQHPGLGIDSASHGFSGKANGGGETFKVNTTSGDFSIEPK